MSGSNVLENANDEVTLTAAVMDGESTLTLPQSSFSWTRESGNETADAAWNASHAGCKSITVSRSELSGNTRFSVTVTPQESYGAFTPVIAADGSLWLQHAQSANDAGDAFSFTPNLNGVDELTLDTTRATNPYTLTDGMLTVTTSSVIRPITSSVVVYTDITEKLIEFAYNADGLRVQKRVTVDDTVVTTDYNLHGKLITHMTVTTEDAGVVTETHNLHFFYDAQSRPLFVTLDGKVYVYVYNLQGDVVALLDKNGSKVVEYRYDAWGRSLGITGTLKNAIGKLNPFRYRGYVWDEETELYYLRSRYYDAWMGRFVSADSSFTATQIGVGNNVFCYGNNNLIICHDDNGSESIEFGDMCGILVFLKKDLFDQNIVGSPKNLTIEYTGHIATIVDGVMWSYGYIGKLDENYNAGGQLYIYNSVDGIKEYMKKKEYIQCYYCDLSSYKKDIQASREFISNSLISTEKSAVYRLSKDTGFDIYNPYKSACIDFVSFEYEYAGIDIQGLHNNYVRYPRLLVYNNQGAFARVSSAKKTTIVLEYTQ